MTEPAIPPGRAADVAAWLMMIRAHAELMDEAPPSADPAVTEAMNRRRLDEVHVCARCCQRAECAVIMTPDLDTPARAVWLDTCQACFGWLLAGMAELQGLGLDLDGRPLPLIPPAAP